jgi:hypothetical protein
VSSLDLPPAAQRALISVTLTAWYTGDDPGDYAEAMTEARQLVEAALDDLMALHEHVSSGSVSATG